MTWITLNHFLSGLLRTDYEKIILAATQHYHHPRVGLRTVGHLVICCSGNMFDVIISFTIFPLQDPSTYLLHPIIQRQQHCACNVDDTFVMKIRWYISLKCHIEIQYNKVNNCLVISQLSYNIGNWQWTEKWEDRINKWSFNLTDIIHSRIVVAALIDSRWRKASVKCKVNIWCVCGDVLHCMHLTWVWLGLHSAIWQQHRHHLQPPAPGRCLVTPTATIHTSPPCHVTHPPRLWIQLKCLTKNGGPF